MDHRVIAEHVVRSLMPRFWRLRLREVHEQGRWVAHARGPFTRISQYASSPEEALSGLATGLAEHRLPKVFVAAGWTVLGREADPEALFVLSPSGKRWAVAVGDPGDARLHSMLVGMIQDAEIPMHLAVVRPLATRTPRELIQAIDDWRLSGVD